MLIACKRNKSVKLPLLEHTVKGVAVFSHRALCYCSMLTAVKYTLSYFSKTDRHTDVQLDTIIIKIVDGFALYQL